MKAFRLVQHTLIPSALFMANIALAHLLYLLSEGRFGYATAAVLISLLLLAAGIINLNKYVLSGGIVLYILLWLFAV